MQDIKIISLNRLRKNSFRRLREITAERPSQHNTGFIIVLPRSDQRKRNLSDAGFFFPTGQHTEIIVRSLIGPAALPVIRLVIAEPGCKRLAEIKRSNHIRLFPEFKRDSIPVFPCLRQKETHRKRIPSSGTVILHQEIKRRRSGNGHTGTVHRNYEHFCLFPKQIERIPGLENMHRKLKFPAIRANLSAGILQRRCGHVKSDLPGTAATFQNNFHTPDPRIHPVRGQFLPQRSFQRRRIEFRFQRRTVTFLHNKRAIQLCRPSPLFIKTGETDRNTADLNIAFFVNFQFRKKRKY